MKEKKKKRKFSSMSMILLMVRYMCNTFFNVMQKRRKFSLFPPPRSMKKKIRKESEMNEKASRV